MVIIWLLVAAFLFFSMNNPRQTLQNFRALIRRVVYRLTLNWREQTVTVERETATEEIEMTPVQVPSSPDVVIDVEAPPPYSEI